MVLDWSPGLARDYTGAGRIEDVLTAQEKRGCSSAERRAHFSPANVAEVTAGPGRQVEVRDQTQLRRENGHALERSVRDDV